MRKRLSGIFAVLAVLALSVFCFAACSKSGTGDGNGNGGGSDITLDGIIVGAVTFNEPGEGIDGFIVSWTTPVGAQRYDFTCGDFHTVIEGKAKINLLTESDYRLVAGEDIHITVIAQADRRPDSAPAQLTYKVKGVDLKSPEIVSFENGILEWKGNTPNDKYLLKVDGAVQTDGTDGYWHSNKLDISDYIGGHNIEISAVGDGDYLRNSPVVSCAVNSAHTKLAMPQIDGYTIENGVLSWQPIGGASGYRVIDLNRNVTITTATSVDLADRNIVYGVYALSGQSEIADAEIIEADIPYLTGEGTATSPYLINNAFELRAIDFYEARYAEHKKTAAGTPINHYKINADIDYNAVAATEDTSNIYTLSKPFCGVLDGNGKKLKNMRVVYDGGYWALFDYIVQGSTVKNMTFESPEITNRLQAPNFPLGAKIATVAYRNYGTISGITVANAQYSASGGEVSGICSHNYGTVTGCEVSGTFTQVDTGLASQACYEMAGVVLENCNGGRVTANKVKSLTIKGSASHWEYYDESKKGMVIGGYYNNVRTAGGIVSVNRAGGVVSNNSYETLNMLVMLDNYKDTTDGNGNTSSGFEFGGLVAYNAGTVTLGTGSIGTFTWSATASGGSSITKTIGSSADWRGKYVGKNDGTCN